MRIKVVKEPQRKKMPILLKNAHPMVNAPPDFKKKLLNRLLIEGKTISSSLNLALDGRLIVRKSNKKFLASNKTT